MAECEESPPLHVAMTSHAGRSARPPALLGPMGAGRGGQAHAANGGRVASSCRSPPRSASLHFVPAGRGPRGGAADGRAAQFWGGVTRVSATADTAARRWLRRRCRGVTVAVAAAVASTARAGAAVATAFPRQRRRAAHLPRDATAAHLLRDATAAHWRRGVAAGEVGTGRGGGAPSRRGGARR